MVSRKRPPFLRRTRRADEDQVPLRPGSDAPVGWIYSVEQKLRQLYQETEGLKLRLGTEYKGGVPACYIGERLFTPEEPSFNINPYGYADTGGFPIQETVQPVNYVVRSGQSYSIPLVIDGPGTFAARYLKVTISQRYNFPKHQANIASNGGGVIWFPMPPKDFMNVGNGPDPAWFWQNNACSFTTIKWSIMCNATYPSMVGIISDDQVAPINTRESSSLTFGVNYFWNIVDRDSDRKYCDDLVSSNALLRQGSMSPVDGNLLKFNTPWLFERAGIIDFEWFPVTDVLQLDPTSTSFPLITTANPSINIDDREDGGTKRDQSVLVKVELHGTKYFDKWDYIRREAS